MSEVEALRRRLAEVERQRDNAIGLLRYVLRTVRRRRLA